MSEGDAVLGRSGQFPGEIRPKKECIKSCETCFAKNALNFLIRVQARNEFVSQSLWTFSYLTLTQNKPSEFFECYLLFANYCLTMINEDLP